MSLTTGGNGHEPHYDLPEPHPDLSPDDVARIILDALQHNDDPGPDCGVRVAYNFTSPANRMMTGPLPRFANMVHNALHGIFINFQEARIEPTTVSGDHARLAVHITGKDGGQFSFYLELSRQAELPYRNCWMTDGVMPFEE